MKLLFLTSRFPYPLEKGDKLRAFELIKHLSRYHEIILFTINDSEVSETQLEKLKPYCSKICVHIISEGYSYLSMSMNIFSSLPFSVAYFYDHQAKLKIENIIESMHPTFIFCHLVRMSEYVRHIKHTPKLLDYMDAFSAGMMRKKKISGHVNKFFSGLEGKRLQKYERDIFDDFEYKTIISEQDRDLIDHPYKKQIEVVPIGVDFDYFTPSLPPVAHPSYDLLFAGNMNYPPNIESVLFIVHKILPLLKKDFPELKLVIAGAQPASEIKKLANENIIVTGWVDDIRKYFYESKIMLAPMLISIGMQNKILQSMAMRTPCIISTLANNAIGAIHLEHALIADTPEEYASAIKDLLGNEKKRNAIAENAEVFVKGKFDWGRIVEKLNELTIR